MINWVFSEYLKIDRPNCFMSKLLAISKNFHCHLIYNILEKLFLFLSNRIDPYKSPVIHTRKTHSIKFVLIGKNCFFSSARKRINIMTIVIVIVFTYSIFIHKFITFFECSCCYLHHSLPFFLFRSIPVASECEDKKIILNKFIERQ